MIKIKTKTMGNEAEIVTTWAITKDRIVPAIKTSSFHMDHQISLLDTETTTTVEIVKVASIVAVE